MKDLEPAVYRQRLIIEGHYGIDFTDNLIKDYLNNLSELLKMRIFSGPLCWPQDKRNHPEVELLDGGLNGFVAWTESGCHVYAFASHKFFTADIYSCKPFEVPKVVEYTQEFIQSQDMVFQAL